MKDKDKKKKKQDKDNRVNDYSYCDVPYVPVDTTSYCDVVICDCPCDCGC